MNKDKNDMHNLINKAIDTSFEFEKKMDSIDFNSYLPEGENTIVKDTPEYRNYKDLVDEAIKCCDNVFTGLHPEIQKKVDELVPKIKGKEKKYHDSILIDLKTVDEMMIYLIYQLFEAKKMRLEGRKHMRQEEKRKYVDCAHILHKTFDYIPKEEFYNTRKECILFDNFNWAKVLYYNEMSICYSGLVESSMSLGYAESAISIIKEIKKVKNGEDKRICKLETFALCNKGEAERNLHDYDKALLTFNKIIEKCNGDGKEFPDYYQALFRSALIFNDQGRGKEAIDLLKKMEVSKEDTRYGVRDLEIASAFIDQKNYEKSYEILEPFTNDNNKVKQEHTFTQRKAKVYKLRLLIELKKNQPEDFVKPGKKIIEITTSDYKNFRQTAKKLLNECVKRCDGNLFKKTCTYLADYFHEESENHKKNKKKELENRIKELGCYYLYLQNKYILEKNSTSKKKFSVNKIINEWISVDQNRLKELIEKHSDSVEFNKSFDEVDDERYLRGFFETYFSICVENEYKPSIKEKKIIEKLKERIIVVYREKDNLIESGEVQEKYDCLEEILNPTNNKIAKDSEKFISECFFKIGLCQDDKKSIFLYPDSILSKMQHNTLDFAEKIVGKTKRFPKDDKFKAVLTILRRWNSFTPALASSVNPSKGGGYFLYFQFNNDPYGIAIDPGYDFLDNLFSQGFRIGDIDAVIVSHAHPDHADDLPSILSLFHELNGHLGEYYYSNRFNKEQFNKKHLKLIISQGVFDQYYKLIKPSEESLKDIFVIQANKNGDDIVCDDYEFDKKYSIKIKAFATSHKDLRQWESLGFLIEIINNKIPFRRIGYTSDAHWKSNFFEKFEGCNIICAHLGSIVDILNKKEFCSLCGDYDKCEKHLECKEKRFENGNPTTKKLVKQAQEQNHLYLSGLTMFFNELLVNGEKKNNAMELAVISEFGEELKEGIRMDLFHKFDDWFQKRSKRKARCFPGDIGLEIDLLNGNILCCCCQEFKIKNNISPIAYGKDEAIFFVCDECKSVLSTYQIEQKLKNYYENGRKLELEDTMTIKDEKL
ncbi:MAG: MBL fold metallo-hydrolase [Actinobacteria bacterium]|nr:MBL fold metallo-hydrolase [Actinomycetota bacterium]